MLAGSEQHSFVLHDLASVDRSLTPWLVVGGHRPFYIDSTNNMEPDGDQPVATALREAFEDAFFDYQVSHQRVMCIPSTWILADVQQALHHSNRILQVEWVHG